MKPWLRDFLASGDIKISWTRLTAKGGLGILAVTLIAVLLLEVSCRLNV